MAALLTTAQSRWLLSLLVGVLSAIAIGSSAPKGAGGETMLSGRPGDIRGMAVIMGCAGLGIVGLSRLAQVLLPRPWRIYADRLEFTCVAMLWICWTSATMAFSSFTLGEGVCSSSDRGAGVLLPTCPLLTFDLALLHLLSTATLALLLVTLSNTLSPSYNATLSEINKDPASGSGSAQRGNVLVMWELAISSPPPSPTLHPVAGSGYGSTDLAPASASSSSVPTSTARRDRFAEGRVLSYSLLLVVSLGVIVSAILLIGLGEFVASSVFMIVVAVSSAAFAIAFLTLHRKPKKETENRSFLRALEVGLAGSLFLLWPLAAISFTLFPSIPNRACDNPASSVTPPSDPFTSEDSTCYLSFSVITLSWIAAWVVFARLLGIVFPLPHVDGGGSRIPPVESTRGHEGTSLLRPRPQVGYGRIVAGEAFELGDDDDD